MMPSRDLHDLQVPDTAPGKSGHFRPMAADTLLRQQQQRRHIQGREDRVDLPFGQLDRRRAM